eukprot:Awhi_evm1s713
MLKQLSWNMYHHFPDKSLIGQPDCFYILESDIGKEYLDKVFGDDSIGMEQPGLQSLSPKCTSPEITKHCIQPYSSPATLISHNHL